MFKFNTNMDRYVKREKGEASIANRLAPQMDVQDGSVVEISHEKQARRLKYARNLKHCGKDKDSYVSKGPSRSWERCKKQHKNRDDGLSQNKVNKYSAFLEKHSGDETFHKNFVLGLEKRLRFLDKVWNNSFFKEVNLNAGKQVNPKGNSNGNGYVPIIDYLESLACYFTNVIQCTSWSGVLSCTLLYYKSLGIKGIAIRVLEYIHNEEFILHGVTKQDGDEFTDEWMSTLRSSFKNWRVLVENPAFKQVSKLLSLAAAVGLCDAAKFNIDFKGVNIFALEAQKRHVKATDFIDGMLETIAFFLEGGYWYLKHGNFNKLLYTDAEINSIENDYFSLKANSIHVRSGNLQKLTGMTENDYSHKLQSTLERLKSFMASIAPGFERKQLSMYYSDLKKVEAEFNADRTSGKLRVAPYAVFIHGRSGVGKSSVAKLSMMQALRAGGYDASDERIVTINGEDKYMSNYRTHINGIFIDDIGNSMPAFIEKAPTAKIIELVNNVPAYANMAEADMKGRVSIEPKSVVLTSNLTLDCIARTYSNEPFSIVRRAPLHIFVEVKKGYCLPDGRLDSSKVPDSLIPDVWNCKVYKPDGDNPTFPLSFVGDYDIAGVLRLINTSASLHYKHQDKIVAASNNLAEKLCFCDACNLPRDLCLCKFDDAEELDKQSGFFRSECYDAQLDDDDDLSWESLRNTWCDNVITRNVGKAGKFAGETIKSVLTHNYCVQLYQFCANEWKMSAVTLVSFMGIVTRFMPITFTPFVYIFVPCIFIKSCVDKYFGFLADCSNLRRRRGSLAVLLKLARDIDKRALVNTCVLFGGAVALYKFYKGLNRLNNQGNIIPCCEADVEQRDSEKNPWLQTRVTEIPTSPESKTSTISNVCSVVRKNLTYMRVIDEPDKIRHSNMLFMRSNVALIPKHMWSGRDNMQVQIIKGPQDTVSSSFSTIISRAHSVDVPNSDLSLVYVASGGSWKNITKFLPVADIRKCSGVMIYRHKDGTFLESRAMINPKTAMQVQDESYDGFDYTLPLQTFNGLCMATWVSETPAPVILGFHLAGRTNTGYGASGTLTFDQFEAMFDLLSNIPGVLTSKDEGNMVLHQYGVSYYLGDSVHPKSPLNYLEGPGQVDYFGQCIGRATYSSEVVKTNISDIVKDITGVPNKWGKPKFFPNWKPFRDNLAVVSDPAMPFPGDLLSRAITCYTEHILDTLFKHAYMCKDMRPLTEMENVCGIDGKRFIDAIPSSTSLGFPLHGSKSKRMTILDPSAYPNFACPKELDREIWEEADRLEAIYLKGERGYPIFKGCLKDEPTSITKDKVRVFQAAPVAFQLLIRKYFLPIARFLQMFPTQSEMAVGINAFGPEWDQMAKYVSRYGKDRILAGDYSKYDTRMPAQMTLAAFSILIDIARETNNYSVQDLEIMRGIASDCCYPVVAFNGDLLQFYGSNPSGNNITVVINCIVNVLNLRCAYYALRPASSDVPFRKSCSLITYGDDFKASVREGCEWFNHIAVANFLKPYGQILTMPDKKSDPIPFMKDEDVDFLKRKNVYNEDLGLLMGALDEDSIFKSLHAVLRSKVLTNNEQCACNIDGALREWFCHGRETYERRRLQMNEIASRAALTHMCFELGLSYDERLVRYRNQYITEETK